MVYIRGISRYGIDAANKYVQPRTLYTERIRQLYVSMRGNYRKARIPFSFIRNFQTKKRIPPDTALLSERSLAKEWLRPEEERAWDNL